MKAFCRFSLFSAAPAGLATAGTTGRRDTPTMYRRRDVGADALSSSAAPKSYARGLGRFR